MPRRRPRKWLTAEDAWGGIWDVGRSDAGDGIDWLRGWPAEWSKRRGATIIITPDVKTWVEAHPRNAVSRDTLAQVPIGKTAMQRLRRELGIDRSGAAEAWWTERMDDLLTSSNVDFAVKYSVCDNSVSVWRKRLNLPPLEHPDAWYLQPDALALITSETAPLLAVARSFNRSVKTIWQLRHILRKRGVKIANRQGLYQKSTKQTP